MKQSASDRELNLLEFSFSRLNKFILSASLSGTLQCKIIGLLETRIHIDSTNQGNQNELGDAVDQYTKSRRGPDKSYRPSPADMSDAEETGTYIYIIHHVSFAIVLEPTREARIVIALSPIYS